METLNIFNSIYFFIAFIIGAAFMLTMTITSMGEVQKPRTNARFFVTKGKSYDKNNAYKHSSPDDRSTINGNKNLLHKERQIPKSTHKR